MSSLAGKQGPRYRHMAEDGAPYETIAVEKLTPIIGAEISGVDIGRLVSDDVRSNQQMDEIHRALAENLVIFFRDQHISPQQHLAFGRKFGELHFHPAAPHEDEDPALMKIYADKNSPRANGEGWHSDVSCDLEPPMGSILYIKQCPPRGGDTLFANMYAAYEALSDRMKAYLDGLTALHDGEPIYRGLYANYGVADRPSYPNAEHPVLRTHPVTGRKALYVNPAASLATSTASRATRATRCSPISTSTPRTRCSSAASAGPRTPSPSGTTAAPSTVRCGTTGRTRARGHG
ncbi:taurine dioxygenase [Bradyrhizobium diazoefficiens]